MNPSVSPAKKAFQPGFGLPPFSYLNHHQMKQLHDASITILEEIGTVVDHQPAIALLEENGARVENNRKVYIPRNLVETALKQTSEQLVIFDRNGNPAMHLEADNVYFGTGPDCPYLLDINSGERKDFSLNDLKDAVKLADALPYIDFVMSMGLAGELESHSSFLTKFKAMVTHTTKPLVIVSGPNVGVLEKIVQIVQLISGTDSKPNQKPTFLLLVDPTSPLVHSDDAIQKLMFMASAELPVIYAPGIMAGATSPVTIAGAIAQANAEILAGLVIHQLVKPGAPFVYGGGMSPLDMKSGQPTYSSPEAIMSQAGLCQLGKSLYHLPTWGFGGCSVSKICDEQAVAEASNYLMMSSWMGCNLVHDVGYLEFGTTFSLELMVICDEIIGQIRRLMEGIVIDDEHLALDTIKRVGPGGNFLADEHTMRHYKRNWQPDLIDRSTRKKWQKQGSSSMTQRAIQKINRILTEHQPKPIAEEVLLEIERVE